jgi:hypothetical protein
MAFDMGLAEDGADCMEVMGAASPDEGDRHDRRLRV